VCDESPAGVELRTSDDDTTATVEYEAHAAVH